MQSLPTVDDPFPVSAETDCDDDDGDVEIEFDPSLTEDAKPQQPFADVKVDYSTSTPDNLALFRVLATTKDVRRFVDTAEGLGKYPLGHVTLEFFHLAANEFQLSGFRAALEAADASLAKSSATLSVRDRRPRAAKGR